MSVPCGGDSSGFEKAWMCWDTVPATCLVECQGMFALLHVAASRGQLCPALFRCLDTCSGHTAGGLCPCSLIYQEAGLLSTWPLDILGDHALSPCLLPLPLLSTLEDCPFSALPEPGPS